MAAPKRRHSKTRQKKRRTHQGIVPAHLVECKNCRDYKLPHRVCESCGYYNGRQVLEVDEV